MTSGGSDGLAIAAWRDYIAPEIFNDLLPVLNREGGTARLVGGTVRDALLSRRPSDIDIATTLRPGAVQKRFIGLTGLSAGFVSYRHGSLQFRFNRQAITVTSLRRDVAGDGRRARIVYVTDWRQDAARRDFTVNALYGDCDGRIYDPLNKACRDLADRRICFIGDPDNRVREDHLRILRFFRFFSHIAAVDIDAAGFAACVKYRAALHHLAGVHVRREIFGILMGKRANEAIGLMHRGGIFEILFGAAPSCLSPDKDVAGIARTATPLRALAALLPPDMKLRRQVAERLALSNKDRTRFLAM